MNTFLLTVMSCLLVIGHSVPIPTFSPSEDLFLENADDTIPIEHGVGDRVRVHEISQGENEPVTTIQVDELVTVIIDVDDSEEMTTNREGREEVQPERAVATVEEEATTRKTPVLEEDGIISFIHSYDEAVVEEVVTENVMTMTETVPKQEETEEIVDDTIHIEADIHIEGGNNGGKIKIEELRIHLVRDVDAVDA